MRTGTGIFLITVGAILLFALKAGSPSWLNLHTVGIILILAGALGLLLPRRSSVPRDRLRRWVVPRTSQVRDKTWPGNNAPPGENPAAYGDRPVPVQDFGVNGDRPTLADDLLRLERDPPV